MLLVLSISLRLLVTCNMIVDKINDWLMLYCCYNYPLIVS